MTAWVAQEFPLHADRFFRSVSYRLLSQLSASLISVKYPKGSPANLNKYHQDVLNILPGVEILASNQRALSLSAVDAGVLQKLKVPAPNTSAEVKMIGYELLVKLRKILQASLVSLRAQHVSAHD